MFAPLAWIFQKIARRYDRRDFFRREPLPDALPPRWVRILRWFFGAPFTAEGSPDAIFHRWIQRFALVVAYLLFLWFLYESFWAWGIFD